MSDYLPNLAYLLVTEFDVATNRELPAGVSMHLQGSLYAHAALYAHLTGVAPTFLTNGAPTLRHWSDLEEVVRHARNTVKDSFADGWLPKDATAPF